MYVAECHGALPSLRNVNSLARFLQVERKLFNTDKEFIVWLCDNDQAGA